jgi:hypothetical protein
LRGGNADLPLVFNALHGISALILCAIVLVLSFGGFSKTMRVLRAIERLRLATGTSG